MEPLGGNTNNVLNPNPQRNPEQVRIMRDSGRQQKLRHVAQKHERTSGVNLVKKMQAARNRFDLAERVNTTAERNTMTGAEIVVGTLDIADRLAANPYITKAERLSTARPATQELRARKHFTKGRDILLAKAKVRPSKARLGESELPISQQLVDYAVQTNVNNYRRFRRPRRE